MISVICCSNNADKTAATKALYANALAGEEYELVIIDDAKSMCEGYNRGVAQSKGGILIFSHNDAGPLRPCGTKLRRHLRDFDIIGGAGTRRLDGPMWFTAGPPHVHGQVLNVCPPAPNIGVDLAQTPQGLVIAKVQPGSQAESSGALVGDLVTHVGHIAINNPAHFSQLVIESLNARQTIALGYKRPGFGTKQIYLDFTAGVPVLQMYNLSAFGVFAPITGGIQAIDGFFMACNRDAALRITFNEQDCNGFHMYDVDWSFRAYRAGLKIGVANDLCLGHASTGGYADGKWKPAADKWMAKYGNQLASHKQLQYCLTSAFFPSLDEAVLMMEELVDLTR